MAGWPLGAAVPRAGHPPLAPGGKTPVRREILSKPAGEEVPYKQVLSGGHVGACRLPFDLLFWNAVTSSQSAGPVPGPSSAPWVGWPRAFVWAHWATVVLVLAGLALVLVRDQVETRALRAALLQWHRTAGLLVLVAAGCRLLLWASVRFRRPVPRPVGSRLAQGLATLVHGLLHGLMWAVPVLGVLLSAAHGSLTWAFGLSLPALMAPDPDWADVFGGWHACLAWTLLALAGLHALAAVAHHVLGHDPVLRRMWPFAPPVPSPQDPADLRP